MESFVSKVNEFCSIVDRPEIRLVGIGLNITYESRGYGGDEFASNTLNDWVFARKLILGGDIALLARVLGIDMSTAEIISARHDAQGDGNYGVVVGFALDRLDTLPDALPEYASTLTVPACRYVRMSINQDHREGRSGYDERMHADEYFIGGFRHDTEYVYNSEGCPLNTYDLTGDMLTKYEPVKIPRDETERFDSTRFKPVMLPEMRIACSVSKPEGDEFVIMKYFKVENQVFQLPTSRYYRHDYYGFPIHADTPQGYVSCFGTRVLDFNGLPDCVEKITLPGGLYLHVTQLEFNGDNPSMPYDVAFNHLSELYFAQHPEYQRDMSRHVIARFRQANCSSVFVPLTGGSADE